MSKIEVTTLTELQAEFCLSLVQVLGRFLILFVVLRPAEEIHEHPIVYVLFLVWSLIELIR